MPARLLIALAALLLGLPPATAEPRKLTIYTYDSFAADWGPGPLVGQEFEAICDCAIEWHALDDAAVLLSRVSLEGAATRADVVLGLDTSLLERAKQSGLFAPHGVHTNRLSLPEPWDDEVFLPFDYGHFAIVYDSEVLAAPPASLRELVEQEGPKLIIQDPRSSTPGLGLLLWVKRVYGNDAPAAWAKLSRRILTVTKGWSEAYGLFLEGEAPMVLSYLTSPAYHMMYEDTDRYRAAVFEEGHYPQIEIAARTIHARSPELAQSFLAFMLTPGFQNHIPGTNIMNPVIDIGDALPAEFAALPTVETLEPIDSATVAEHQRAWIDEWLSNLGP